MIGDCSTCNHSHVTTCADLQGREFLESSANSPCPHWEPQNHIWKQRRDEWEKTHAWPFPISGVFK